MSDSLSPKSFNSEDFDFTHSKVVWQWQQTEATPAELLDSDKSCGTGKTNKGWVSYNPRESCKIEQAFQNGLERCKLKVGGKTPMELFLYDKMQYDPVTGSAHHIRRVGIENLSQKVVRRCRSFLRQVVTGSMKHKTFLRYKKELSKKENAKTGGRVRPVLSDLCKRIVKHYGFVPVQMTAILCNAAFLGFDADYNHPAKASSSTQSFFRIFEHCFCVFFTVELTIRFGAMEQRAHWSKFLKHVLTNGWFMFDFVLVLLMVLETWVLPLFSDTQSGLNRLSTLRLLRMARLTRLGRIARLLNFFPEIGIMVKSMVSSLRAVFSTFILMVLMLYTFAIIFKTQAEDSQVEELFPSIADSMWFLLVHGSFMDELSSSVEAVYSGKCSTVL